MWFESDILNILIILLPVLFVMWLEGKHKKPDEDENVDGKEENKN